VGYDSRFPSGYYAVAWFVDLSLVYITVVWTMNFVNLFGSVKSGWPPFVAASIVGLIWIGITEIQVWKKWPKVFWTRAKNTRHDVSHAVVDEIEGGLKMY